MLKFILYCIALMCVFTSFAQQPTAAEQALFSPPNMYAAHYTKEPFIIDGNLNEKSWAAAKWSHAFVDIEGDKKPVPTLQTKMKMLWSDSCLYIAAMLEEPHVWATLTKHDAIIFHDNDFEVFIDPFNSTQPYFEIEVNALNTIFDLLLPKPYRNGGSAMIGYDVQGLRTAVQINGTLNQPADTDSGWLVEMAIPFQALTLGNDVHIPTDGEQWRINFSRVEWDTEMQNNRYTKQKNKQGKTLPEHNWVWSSQGVVNMHYPERWGYVVFTKSSIDSTQRPADETARNLLWLAYYRQKAWKEKYGVYSQSLSNLQLTDTHLEMEATTNQFRATIKTKGKNLLSINQDGLISQMPPP